MSITGMLLSSLLLIVAAAVSLVYGWINASAPLVVASIALSAASAIFMAMGLYRSRPPRSSKSRRPAPRRSRAGRSGK